MALILIDTDVGKVTIEYLADRAKSKVSISDKDKYNGPKRKKIPYQDRVFNYVKMVLEEELDKKGGA